VSRGGSRTRNALLACEAALAVMLLVGAVLLARSFTELVQVDAGYDADRVLVATIHFTGAAREPGRGPAALDRILQRVRAMPGIEAAGAGNMAPFSGVMAGVTLAGPGWTGPDGQPITVRAVSPTVTPGYAEALRLRLRAGRFFHDDDGAQATTPVIVNETFARLHLAGREPAVGGRIDNRVIDDAFEIVGIVADFLPARLDAAPEPEMFLPQPPDRGIRQMTLVVLTTGDPSAFAPTLRSIVRDVEPAAVLDGVGPLGARVAESVAQPRFAASVLAAFTALALLLAASGLYGVLSYVVSQRRRELGIRAALGAGRAHLMALVLRHGFVATVVGLLAGLAGAAATTRLMAGLLFGISPLDAVSFAVAPALLTLVALAACLVPAVRASTVDPAEVLRAE
jgi:predicted permease